MLATIVRNRHKGEFILHEYVIMPNHMHLLVTVDDDHSIGRAMQLIKGGFSHAIGKAGLKFKAVWQPSYYEHRVRDEIEYERMRRCRLDAGLKARTARSGLGDVALTRRISRARPKVTDSGSLASLVMTISQLR